jgi:predicted RNA-binding Zn-ribbon protein involved in translation (DUF1610 family)
MPELDRNEILEELNGNARPAYIDARREETVLKKGKKAGKAMPRWKVLLRCPECGEEEWRRLDYARRVLREGRPHLCTGCSQSGRY